MKEILKAIWWSTALVGSTISVIFLGLWCHSGSKIALVIAITLIWLLTVVMIYYQRNYM